MHSAIGPRCGATARGHATLYAHGNISALSLGWNWCWTPTPWHDVVVRLLVTPSRFHSGDFSGELQLEDADGHSVPLTADYPIEKQEFAGGTIPEGISASVDLPVWSIFRVPPLDLKPGRYQWRFTSDGEVATYPFEVYTKSG